MAAAEQTFQELVAQLDYPMFIATWQRTRSGPAA
jgi:hypothetical protein